MANTRVVALMFHRINEPHLGYDPQRFAQYLEYLVQHFPIVLPGEPLTSEIAVCLTFDDAYFDFYHNVYPLLQKYNIKALLAVPTKYISDTLTPPAPHVRLSVPYAHDMNDLCHQAKTPFCTWQELQEMANSGLVAIASHGFGHTDLGAKTTDLDQEIVFSQTLLQQKLKVPVRYFVYPFGKMTREIHKKVCQTYDYGIRIGGSLNYGWQDSRRFIYRINADPLWLSHRPIQGSLIQNLTLKYWFNRLRLK